MNRMLCSRCVTCYVLVYNMRLHIYTCSHVSSCASRVGVSYSRAVRTSMYIVHSSFDDRQESQSSLKRAAAVSSPPPGLGFYHDSMADDHDDDSQPKVKLKVSLSVRAHARIN